MDLSYILNSPDVERIASALELLAANSGQSIFTDAMKTALLNIFRHVAYADDQGQAYYDALEAALYPAKTVVSISAVFAQGTATIFTSDDLDDLKQYLTVTATYDDQTTAVVTDYTLIGTLTKGTSTITVRYGRKTTTFTATVSFGYRIPGSKLVIQTNSQSYPYYDQSNVRISYSDFDLLMEGGKSYRIEMDSSVTTANMGIQGYNQNVLTAVANSQSFTTTDLYDPGWQSLPTTYSPPAQVNNSDFAGLRFTMRKDSNNSPIETNFVNEIRIIEVD